MLVLSCKAILMFFSVLVLSISIWKTGYQAAFGANSILQYMVRLSVSTKQVRCKSLPHYSWLLKYKIRKTHEFDLKKLSGTFFFCVSPIFFGLWFSPVGKQALLLNDLTVKVTFLNTEIVDFGKWLSTEFDLLEICFRDVNCKASYI